MQHIDDFAHLRGASCAVRPIAGIVVNRNLDDVTQVAFHRLRIRVILATLNLPKCVARNELDLWREFGKIIS